MATINKPYDLNSVNLVLSAYLGQRLLCVSQAERGLAPGTYIHRDDLTEHVDNG